MQDRIEFKGSIKPIEIISEIKKSKFFILLTKYEGFGMSIAECAAAGLEIITTDLPVLREVLGNYPVDFVDLKDIDNIGRKINEKLSRNSVNAKNEDIIYNSHLNNMNIKFKEYRFLIVELKFDVKHHDFVSQLTSLIPLRVNKYSKYVNDSHVFYVL